MSQKRIDYIEASAALPAIMVDTGVRTSRKAAKEVNNQRALRLSRKYWLKLGPGLVTEASGQDPSGIATFSQTGAQYGFQFLWVQVWLYPLDSNITTMCARIGLVTGKGLAANIRSHFSKKVLYACALLMFTANAINIGADLGAMAKAVQLIHANINFDFLVIAFAILSVGFQLYTPYAQYSKYLKWLALALLSYVASAILAHLNWSEILRQSMVPHFSLTKNYFIIACAVLGTTISPYLFFWQTSQEVEEQILKLRHRPLMPCGPLQATRRTGCSPSV